MSGVDGTDWGTEPLGRSATAGWQESCPGAWLSDRATRRQPPWGLGPSSWEPWSSLPRSRVREARESEGASSPWSPHWAGHSGDVK